MVVFDPVAHSYTNELTGERYLSCTQLLGKYKKKFEADIHAARVARKRGVSKEEVLAEWAANTKSRCDYGTSIHEAIEEYILNSVKLEGFEKCIDELDKVIPYNKKKVKPEHLLYNHEYKIAGTSDIIEDVGTSRFNVYDFKTNKEFSFDNKYGEYMLEPLQHLAACDYNAYCLQLSLYAAMYSATTERTVNRMGLLYWHEKTETWTFLPVPYMRHEVLMMLKHYKKTNAI